MDSEINFEIIDPNLYILNDTHIYCYDCESDKEFLCDKHDFIWILNKSNYCPFNNNFSLKFQKYFVKEKSISQCYCEGDELSHLKNSLPDILTFNPSNVALNRIGVWSLELISKGTIFGPLLGSISEIDSHPQNVFEKSVNGYSWILWKSNTVKQTSILNAKNCFSSNWMRCVNCSYDMKKLNLIAIQFDGLIFYRACEDIESNTELVVSCELMHEKDVEIAKSLYFYDVEYDPPCISVALQPSLADDVVASESICNDQDIIFTDISVMTEKDSDVPKETELGSPVSSQQSELDDSSVDVLEPFQSEFLSNDQACSPLDQQDSSEFQTGCNTENTETNEATINEDVSFNRSPEFITNDTINQSSLSLIDTHHNQLSIPVSEPIIIQPTPPLSSKFSDNHFESCSYSDQFGVDESIYYGNINHVIQSAASNCITGSNMINVNNWHHTQHLSNSLRDLSDLHKSSINALQPLFPSDNNYQNNWNYTLPPTNQFISVEDYPLLNCLDEEILDFVGDLIKSHPLICIDNIIDLMFQYFPHKMTEWRNAVYINQLKSKIYNWKSKYLNYWHQVNYSQRGHNAKEVDEEVVCAVVQICRINPALSFTDIRRELINLLPHKPPIDVTLVAEIIQSNCALSKISRIVEKDVVNFMGKLIKRYPNMTPLEIHSRVQHRFPERKSIGLVSVGRVLHEFKLNAENNQSGDMIDAQVQRIVQKICTEMKENTNI